MFVRLTRGSADPARYDDVVAITGDFLTAFKQLPGFGSYQGGINRRTGAFVSITTWETAETANFSRAALGEVLQRLLALGAHLEPAEVYEIVRTE
jgi:hypothetical protein